LQDKLVQIVGTEKAEELEEFNKFIDRNFKQAIATFSTNEIAIIKSKIDDENSLSMDDIGNSIVHSVVIGMHFYREFAIRNDIMTIDFEKDENAKFEVDK